MSKLWLPRTNISEGEWCHITLNMAFCPAEFNVGQYRRDFMKIYKSFEFFRPDNEEGLKIRQYVWPFGDLTVPLTYQPCDGCLLVSLQAVCVSGAERRAAVPRRGRRPSCSELRCLVSCRRHGCTLVHFSTLNRFLMQQTPPGREEKQSFSLLNRMALR